LKNLYLEFNGLLLRIFFLLQILLCCDNKICFCLYQLPYMSWGNILCVISKEFWQIRVNIVSTVGIIWTISYSCSFVSWKTRNITLYNRFKQCCWLYIYFNFNRNITGGWGSNSRFNGGWNQYGKLSYSPALQALFVFTYIPRITEKKPADN
jgi:hypothetical protein